MPLGATYTQPAMVDPTRTYRYTTTLDAAIDARALHGARWARFDRAIDVAAVIAGVVLVATGYVIGFVLVIGGLTFGIFGRQIQRTVLGYRARSMIGKSTSVTADDDGLHAANELATITIPWSSLNEVRSNAKVSIFLRDRLLVFYMPYDAFASPVERAEFEAFARDRIVGSAGV